MRVDVGGRLERTFGGQVTPWVYAFLRVSFALILLVRQSDIFSGLLPLAHHGWVDGLDFSWSIAERPHLVSPLVRGLELSPRWCNALTWARTLLALLLLVGVRSRVSALLLAFVSYWLMLSDRFQYLHHLHLLYSSIAWLALAPLDARLSLERWLRRLPSDSAAPAFPLVLLLAMVSSIYLASALAKLNAPWLGGGTLRVLEGLGMLRGHAWLALRESLGYAGSAWCLALIELALPLLISLPLTRRAGIGLGLILHLGVSLVMSVSSFGLEMACLLAAFLVLAPKPAHH